jgi:hypothetical protein
MTAQITANQSNSQALVDDSSQKGGKSGHGLASI